MPGGVDRLFKRRSNCLGVVLSWTRDHSLGSNERRVWGLLKHFSVKNFKSAASSVALGHGDKIPYQPR